MKICDFGLARDIMSDSNYVVRGNVRLLFPTYFYAAILCFVVIMVNICTHCGAFLINGNIKKPSQQSAYLCLKGFSAASGNLPSIIKAEQNSITSVLGLASQSRSIRGL